MCVGIECRRTLCSWCIRLETIREDVVGCHGEDGGSCWDPWERTAGPGDVNVGVRQRGLRVHTVLEYKLYKLITLNSSYLQSYIIIMTKCEHLVEPRGHDEESCRGLMPARCSGGRQVVALQNVLVLRLSLVELVVLSSDCGHLEHIAQRLSSCMREEEEQVFVVMEEIKLSEASKI